jgi:hypothetical protein
MWSYELATDIANAKNAHPIEYVVILDLEIIT